MALLTRRQWLSSGVALCAGGLSQGCAHRPVSLREGPREYVPFDYDAVLKRWTRSESLVALEEVDDLLNVTATFEAWDFRWAYTVRYARDYRLTIGQRKTLLEKNLADCRRAHQFYVALYGPHRRWNDLTSKNSAWVVRLVDDRGSEHKPEQITRIRRVGAIEKTYFPYTTIWRQAFRLRFPVQDKAGRPTISPYASWVGLRFAGAQGNQDLRWGLGA